MVEYAAQKLGRALNNKAPDKSGNLKRSQQIRVSAPSSDDRVSVSISYDVPYARSSDLGWKGDIIRPKNYKKLYFFWENAPDAGRFHGPDFYEFDAVRHPGWPGTRWYSDLVTPEFWEAALQLAERDVQS